MKIEKHMNLFEECDIVRLDCIIGKEKKDLALELETGINIDRILLIDSTINYL